MKNTFIYIWRNKVKNKYYIGKHFGDINDGYVCSSKVMKIDYEQNPEHFKRRILEFVEDVTGNEGLDDELKWLNMVKYNELGQKYYNLKKQNFGNSRGCKKPYVWNQGLSREEQKEYLEIRKNGLFCLLTEKPSRGVMYRYVIDYNCKHFRSKQERTFCGNSCSSKWWIANGGREIISESKLGKPAWNKGLPNPTAAANGKKGAEKIIGTKILYLDSHKIHWSPGDKLKNSVIEIWQLLGNIIKKKVCQWER